MGKLNFIIIDCADAKKVAQFWSEALEGYYLLHATRGDLLRRMGRTTAAIDALNRALQLTTNDSEQRFLKRRLRELQT